jgi:hypothetical protein
MGIVTIMFVKWPYFSVYIGHVMCFFWGFQDSAINTHAQEILGFEFDDNYTPFSLYNIYQSVCCFLFQIIVSNVNDAAGYFWYTIAATLASALCCSVTYFFPFREHSVHTNPTGGSSDYTTHPKEETNAREHTQ